MRAIILILLSLVLSLDVKALAIASDYLKDNTIELVEGTSTIYSIRLQNPDLYESKVKVDYDNQFMKAIDFKEEYTLLPQSSTRIEFNITAPKYDKNNDLFVIGYTVHQLSAPSGGGIPFLTKINKNFKLRVVENPNKLNVNHGYLNFKSKVIKNPKFNINYNYLVYAAIILFVLYIFKKKRAMKSIKHKSRKR